LQTRGSKTDKQESGSDKMSDDKLDIMKKPSKPQPQSATEGQPQEKTEPTPASIPEGSEQAANENDISTETIDKKDPTRYGDWIKNGRCIDF